jgi:hypothetical protein
MVICGANSQEKKIDVLLYLYNNKNTMPRLLLKIYFPERIPPTERKSRPTYIL